MVPTALTPDGMSVDYNQHNLEFTPAQGAGQPAQMRMRMEGSSGARVQPKGPKQMYGQFEVTAKVASAAGCVTAFYVSPYNCCTAKTMPLKHVKVEGERRCKQNLFGPKGLIR